MPLEMNMSSWDFRKGERSHDSHIRSCSVMFTPVRPIRFDSVMRSWGSSMESEAPLVVCRCISIMVPGTPRLLSLFRVSRRNSSISPFSEQRHGPPEEEREGYNMAYARPPPVLEAN